MRRTPKQIEEQKAAFVAESIQRNARQMADFRAKKAGVNADEIFESCLEIVKNQAHIYAANFDRDFGAKTKKVKVVDAEQQKIDYQKFLKKNYSAHEIALANLHPELHISEIKSVFEI